MEHLKHPSATTFQALLHPQVTDAASEEIEEFKKPPLAAPRAAGLSAIQHVPPGEQGRK